MSGQSSPLAVRAKPSYLRDVGVEERTMLSIRRARTLSLTCALCALGFWSCRNSEDVCTGATCAASSEAGRGAEAGSSGGVDNGVEKAGAAPTPEDSAGMENGALGGAAGAAGEASAGNPAGAGPTSSCQVDAECVDGRACNGDERCIAGQCQAGKPLECGKDLSCVEHGTGAPSCDYGVPGRWLTFIGSNTGTAPFELRASRLEGFVPRPSISLGIDRSYQIISIDSWSPDGRHLIAMTAQHAEQINSHELFGIEFGDGLPSPPALLNKIPVGSNTVSGPWASDSSAVFVQNYSTPSETYLVHFAPNGVRSALLFREDEDTRLLEFCPDPRYFYRIKGDDSMLVDSLHPEREKLLWHAWTESSPDGHWLMNSDDSTGVWLAACEPGSEPLQVADKPSADGFFWSADSQFVAVTHDEPDGEIEVLTAADRFKSVYIGTQRDFGWAPHSPKLILFGIPDTKGRQALTEVDLSALPAKSRARGNTPEVANWGFLNDETLWAARDEAAEKSGFWLLESGTNSWRRVATGLSDARPSFTADAAYVVFHSTLEDGTKQLLAFSLHDKNPVPIPLLPTPLSGEVTREYSLNEGLIVSRKTDLEPVQGQLWWIASGASGFAKPASLSDVRTAQFPSLQPQP